jgi:4-diphosphocytidyl-2-C-methyl-D-erythritol kinase
LLLSGIGLPGPEEENLVMKAYRLLAKRYSLPALHIYLHKAIPAGTGVGAGSADAAFALKLFAQMAGLSLSMVEFEEHALQLGSDCPFFIQNKPALATGRGEQFVPIKLDLNGYWVKMVFPNTHVSTREAFAGITPRLPAYSLAETLSLPVRNWQERLVNDFEKPVFAKYPQLAIIKEKLLAEGAVYASMSGSGSAVYGLFDRPIDEESGLRAGKYIGELRMEN